MRKYASLRRVESGLIRRGVLSTGASASDAANQAVEFGRSNAAMLSTYRIHLSFTFNLPQRMRTSIRRLALSQLILHTFVPHIYRYPPAKSFSEQPPTPSQPSLQNGPPSRHLVSMSKSNDISVTQNMLFGHQFLMKISANTIEQNLQWLACRTEHTRVAWSQPTR